MKNEVKKFKNEAYITSRENVPDYLFFVTKTSTKRQRRKFDIGDIFINAAVCKDCETYIRSTNRHDFKWCECGGVAVDGGSWYIKRVGKNYINVIEFFYDVK